jgi:HD domain-containing protein
MSAPAPFPKRLSVYTAVVFGAAIAAMVALAVREGLPPTTALVCFSLVVVFSSHRRVFFPSGVSVSSAFMVSMAAIVVFVHSHSLAGCLLIGLLSSFYIPNLTRSSWPWFPFNAGITGLANLAAGVAYLHLPAQARETMPAAVVGVIPVAFVCVAVSGSLVALSYVVESGRVEREVLQGIRSSLGQMVPFALLGVLLGRLYLSLGPAVVLLTIVPILIAREMFASYVRVKESHDETVGMLIRALEAKDRYTSGHSERVADYARYIGEELDFMPARLERLRFAALMHDIGKLVVPNQLLNKPGRLTPDEFAKVRVHEKVSVQMLSHIDFLRPIAAASHSDATRFDPDDLDHPIEPYIVMIADAYDAMTSTRAYRKALQQNVAFQELRDKAGVQFHPACVEALIHAVERRGEQHGDGFERDAEFDDAPVTGVGSAGLGDLLDMDVSGRSSATG